MSEEMIASLIRAEGISEDDIKKCMEDNKCERTDAVKYLYTNSRAAKMADAMFAVPVPLTDEQLAQMDEQRKRIEGIIAEQRKKEERKGELRTQIAAVGETKCACCAMYAELVSL